MFSSLIYANTIVRRSLQTDNPISPMKLQKLLYFLYARYLYLHGVPLFSNNIEKWKYGPVVSEVYYEFQKYGGSQVTDFSYDCDKKVYVVSEKHRLFMECFDEVWRRYSGYTGLELSMMTHAEGSAWSKANGPFLNFDDIAEDGRRFFEQNAA